MYVKLRDAGTIFHDGSQDATVSGSLPVKVKATPKVKEAVKSGVLTEVDDKAAQIEIEKAAGNDEKVNALKSVENDAKAAVLALEEQIEANKNAHDEALKVANEDLAKTIEESAGLAEQLKASEASVVDLSGKLEKSEKDSASVVADLTGKLEKAVKDLDAKDKAYETVKAELAKANKK